MDASLNYMPDPLVFNRNQALWFSQFPEGKEIKSAEVIDWEFCKTGKREEWNLRKKSLNENEPTYLYSTQNIQAEVRQWFSSHQLASVDDLIIYGVGLGYHYEVLKGWLNASQTRKVIFLEDDPSILHAFLMTDAATKILNDPQVSLKFVDFQDRKNSVLKGFVYDLLYREVQFSPINYYAKNRKGEISIILYYIFHERSFLRSSTAEYLDAGKIYLSNYFRNLLSYDQCYFGNLLYGNTFKGIPAIICGAGPSLGKNIHLLNSFKDKAIIIAGGTSANALNAYGITPHISVGVDPFLPQFSRLIMNIGFEVPFIIRNRMHHASLELVHGSKIYSSGATGYPLSNYIDEKLGLITKEEPELSEGYNVVNLSLSLAKEMGCNPLICVGVDLAYTEGKSYSPNIVNHAVHDPKQYFITKSINEDLILQNDIHGQPVYSLWKWINESSWFSQFAIKNKDVALINSTEGGLGFAHIPNIPLAETKQWMVQTYDMEGLVHAELQRCKMPETVTHLKILEVIKALADSLIRCLHLLQEIYQLEPDFWSKKGGDESVLKTEAKERIETLKKEEGYIALLKVFDEHYQKYIDRAFENVINQSVPARFPFLLKITVNAITYIEEAINEDLAIGRAAASKSKILRDETGKKIVFDAKEWKELPFDEKSQTGVKTDHHPNSTQVKSKMYFKDGILHGPSLFFAENGNLLAETLYLHGKKEGQSYYYYPSGAVYADQTFVNGLWEGKQLFYYPNGQLKTDMACIQGAFDGKILLYFQNGILQRELHFKKGLRDGSDRIWNALGNLYIEAEYQEDKPIKAARIYYGNGQVAKELAYDQNGKLGAISEWNAAGEKISKGGSVVEDYFDVVTKQSGDFTNSMLTVVHRLDSMIALLEALSHRPESNISISPDVQEDIKSLHAQMAHLKEQHQKMLKETGIERDVSKEPIWKSPQAERLIEQYLATMTESMRESMIGIQIQMNLLVEKLKRKK